MDTKHNCNQNTASCNTDCKWFVLKGDVAFCTYEAEKYGLGSVDREIINIKVDNVDCKYYER